MAFNKLDITSTFDKSELQPDTLILTKEMMVKEGFKRPRSKMHLVSLSKINFLWATQQGNLNAAEVRKWNRILTGTIIFGMASITACLILFN